MHDDYKKEYFILNRIHKRYTLYLEKSNTYIVS